MRLRTLLLATGALTLAGTMALSPTTQANNPNGGPIAKIVVGPFAGNAAHVMTLTTKSAVVQTAVFSTPTPTNCANAGDAGITNGGVSGISPLAGQVITTLALTCGALIPNLPLTITATCPLEIVYADPNVHAGLLDVGVPGNVKFSAVNGTIHMTSRTNPAVHCLKATHANGCQFFIGGSTAVQFDETVKVVVGQNRQDLHLLGGPGLLVKNPTINCFGAFANNGPITLTAQVNEHHANGAVDFQP